VFENYSVHFPAFPPPLLKSSGLVLVPQVLLNTAVLRLPKQTNETLFIIK